MGVKTIKRILTAIGNPILNNRLKEVEGLAVIDNDIQYKEGILEVLETNKKIDFIIMSELIPGEISINDLINNIKNKNNEIKIIIIFDDINLEIKNKINTELLFKKFYNNKVEINEIIQLITEDEKMEKYNYEIKKEINELKEIIKNNQKDIDRGILRNNNKLIKYNDYFKKIKNNYLNNKKINDYFFNKLKNLNKKYFNKIISNNNNKIITILGNNGAGKSIFTIMLANLLKVKNKKILVLDFDFLNNSLHTILGVKKYPNKIKNIINNSKNNNEKINLENLIIKINNKIDLISGINLVFNSNEKNNQVKFENILNNLFSNYDYIIIDTTTESFFDYVKNIIKMSDICFFITEANITEISKSKRLLEIYSNNWNIENEKIKIIFNKYNNNCIDINLLKNIYFDYEIIGKIKLKNNLDVFSKNKLVDCKDSIINLLENKKIKIEN